MGSLDGGEEDPLAFAVVTEPRSLKHRGKPELSDGPIEVPRFLDGQKRRRRNAQFREERFLGQAVLRGF